MVEFKRLSQEKIWELLKEQADVLTPLAQKEQVFFRNCKCPTCSSYTLSQFVNPDRPFAPGSPLPNTLLRCDSCKTEFDPNTNIITSFPTKTMT